MIKKILIIIICTLSIFILSACENNNKQNTENQENTIEYDRTSTNIESSENIIVEKQQTPIETELANFSTPLKSKQPGRLNNIRITCSKINEQIIENGKEFSFCSTIGQSTVEQGYQNASVIVNKKTVQALGGGNCQVSTTLYNTVLAVPNLEVTERHPHGKRVTYVPEGKDAAVSYGSLDLKFKNNNEFKIKIYASTDDVNVTIRIVKIE